MSAPATSTTTATNKRKRASTKGAAADIEEEEGIVSATITTKGTKATAPIPALAKADSEDEANSEEESDSSEESDEEEEEVDSTKPGKTASKKKAAGGGSAGSKKSRRTGEKAIVNTRVVAYCKRFGIRSAKISDTIERWLREHVYQFATEDKTCFDENNLVEGNDEVSINFTYVQTHCPDLDQQHKGLVHVRMQRLVRNAISLACQTCLNLNKQTLNAKLMIPMLNACLAMMLGDNVPNPQIPIIVYRKSKPSKKGPKRQKIGGNEVVGDPAQVVPEAVAV
jgi:hypothetical protein